MTTMLIRQLKTDMATYSIYEHYVDGVKITTREKMDTEFAKRWKAQFYGMRIALEAQSFDPDNKAK